MSRKAEDQIWLEMFYALSKQERQNLDLSNLAKIASNLTSSESDEEIGEIFSLDPETRADLVALRGWLQRGDQAESPIVIDDPSETLEALTQADWQGCIRFGYTLDGLFQLSDLQGDLNFNPWTAKVFEVASRIRNSPGCGLWPTDRIDFEIIQDNQRINCCIQFRSGTTIIDFRVGQQDEESAISPIEVEYWHGEQWVGVTTLAPGKKRLRLPLKPDSPYIYRFGADRPMVLKVVGHPTQFSDEEKRTAAILRVLAGDIRGGFGLVRDRLAPPTQAFQWALSIVAECLPEPARNAGYVVVREGGATSEAKEGIQSLFTALGAGWLQSRQTGKTILDLKDALEQTTGPTSRGFLFALRGRYEEALAVWEDTDLGEPGSSFVVGARQLAHRLSSETQLLPKEAISFPDKDSETAIRFLSALDGFEKMGEENLEALASAIDAACCEANR